MYISIALYLLVNKLLSYPILFRGCVSEVVSIYFVNLLRWIYRVICVLFPRILPSIFMSAIGRICNGLDKKIVSWLNTTNQDHLHWKLYLILYCFILQILLYWYMGMDMYMCMSLYSSPRISDWCDYKHIFVNIWNPGLLTRYIYI